MMKLLDAIYSGNVPALLNELYDTRRVEGKSVTVLWNEELKQKFTSFEFRGELYKYDSEDGKGMTPLEIAITKTLDPKKIMFYNKIIEILVEASSEISLSTVKLAKESQALKPNLLLQIEEKSIDSRLVAESPKENIESSNNLAKDLKLDDTNLVFLDLTTDSEHEQILQGVNNIDLTEL